MAFKPIDNKRDQFRKYLEASGVIEVLSKSITKLMESPEKPESPVEFIRESMGRSQKELNEIEFLKEEVEVYKKQVNDLKMEIAGLKLERKEVETALQSKEVAVVVAADPPITVKEEIVPELNQNDLETKKIADEPVEPAPVLVVATTKTDDVPSADNVNDDVKAAVAAVVTATDEVVPVVSEASDAKSEPKTDDVKTDEKPATPSVGEATAEPVEK